MLSCLRLCFLFCCASLPGCASSVNDYLVEARNGDPESIHDAVVSVGRLLLEKEEQGAPYDKGDENAVKYLMEVAELGKDAVNRASAVDSLSHLKRPATTQLFAGRLSDKAWNVQLEAAKALTRKPDPEAVDALTRRLDADTRPEVRLEILKALAAVGGEKSLQTLLEAFLGTSAAYKDLRLTLYDCLRRLSGKDFAYDDQKGWRAYSEERFPRIKPREALDGPEEGKG